MTRLQLLLTKLAEECNEVAQMALKTQQFGLEERRPGQELTNLHRLHQELDDALAIVKMLNEEHEFNYSINKEAVEVKIRKVNKYAEYSRQLGYLK